MSDTVKLIIEISKDYYEILKSEVEENLTDYYPFIVIGNGIPLDDVKVAIKAMFPPSGNWMYDEECEHEHTVCEVLADVLQILGNIGKEDKE